MKWFLILAGSGSFIYLLHRIGGLQLLGEILKAVAEGMADADWGDD